MLRNRSLHARCRQIAAMLGGTLALSLILAPAAFGRGPIGSRHGQLLIVPGGSGYLFDVQGTGWHPGARMVFSMQVQTQTRGQEIRATESGAFRFHISGTADCSVVTFRATAVGGGSASISTPPVTCAGPLSRQTADLRLHLAVGKSSPATTVRIQGSGSADITMRRGDRISFQESGTPPSFLPHPDSIHFALLSQRDLPSPAACAGPTCGGSHVWVYVAIARGTGLVDMEPACRQSRPQCMIAERAIQVLIT